MAPTKKIAEFVVQTEFRSFPDEAVHLSKRLFMDCLGVALAASYEPVVQKLAKILKAQGGKKEARVWGQGFSFPLSNAVLINGTMAHALDFDDSAFSHPTATLLPVVVGLGEKLQLSCQEVLGALLIGYEVFGTISLCSNQNLLRDKGWHPTPILGTMAAAAAASKLLRLSEKEVLMALGIAGSSAGGLGQNFGSMTKPLHVGFAARSGLFAAQLAQEGISADDHILEAERGFGAAFFGREGHGFDKIGPLLGNPYKVISPGINIKPYPCCRGAHKAIDAALALREKIPHMPAEAEQIESIECDLHLDGPTLYHIPQTGLKGKFSIAYCVSVALLKGSVRLEDFLDLKLKDPALQQLIKKVVNIRIPGEEEVVTIKMKDGKTFSHAVRIAKGDAQGNPLSDAKVADKFQSCARVVLPARQVKMAAQQIVKMEKVKNFRQFMDRIIGAV